MWTAVINKYYGLKDKFVKVKRKNKFVKATTIVLSINFISFIAFFAFKPLANGLAFIKIYQLQVLGYLFNLSNYSFLI